MGRVTTTVAIALGANLGDRAAQLQFAVERLSAILRGVRVSVFIESEPVGVSEPQPPYLNGALVGETSLSARELLTALLAIEQQQGRVRLSHRAPRTLDLDLILYGDAIIVEPDLQVPHPRFRDRAFVLDPLKEIAPELVDPVTGKTIGELP
ncbi:MAG: 2-amino-4-hydroxy-6-hydroxymethyldihydropteridine diphosphokinase [Acidobacteriota bacterium]